MRSVSPRLLLGAAWAFLVAIGLAYTLRLRVSGDEPHYLLMAQSLWREHDLDLRDNHSREDWREYTPGPIVPHYAAPRADGRPYPAHSPGLPLLLAPLYALGAAAHGRRRGRAPGLGARARAAGRVLRVRDLYGGAVRPRSGRLPAPAP